MDKDNQLNLIRTVAIEPWEELGRSLTEQKAIEAAGSDEARECRRLAAEIIRLAGEFGLNNRELCGRSHDWDLISSAADAGKSRLLSSAARRTTLSAAACFEADGNGKYNFLNNRVSIVHPTAGKADFLITAAAAIELLAAELGLDTEWASKIPENEPAFEPSVVLDAGPDKTRVFQGLQIQFYKRDPAGTLKSYQPGEWQLELKTSE